MNAKTVIESLGEVPTAFAAVFTSSDQQSFLSIEGGDKQKAAVYIIKNAFLIISGRLTLTVSARHKFIQSFRERGHLCLRLSSHPDVVITPVHNSPAYPAQRARRMEQSLRGRAIRPNGLKTRDPSSEIEKQNSTSSS